MVLHVEEDVLSASHIMPIRPHPDYNEITQAIQELARNGRSFSGICYRCTEPQFADQIVSGLGWSRNQLAFVMNASDRAIVNWEQGDPISPVYAAKLREIQSVYNELKQLMKPEEIGPWLLSEMDEFENRTPADLISKGETGRLWASLFYLRSGMPD